MKEQEAVERLKCMRLFMQIEDDKNESKFLEDDYIANDMAIKALEKQVAKKPIDRCMFKECPDCHEIEIQYCNYCPTCGQKLDWSEEDDR